MEIARRVTTVLPQPRWVYRPGQGTPDRETLEAAKALVPARYGSFVPADDAATTYGLALNDAGFFWECHEILEAVWKVAPQGGPDRILLRACIQIANANLKSAMGRPRAAARLYAEAVAELQECARRAPISKGFAAGYPVRTLAEALARPAAPVLLVIASGRRSPTIMQESS